MNNISDMIDLESDLTVAVNLAFVPSFLSFVCLFAFFLCNNSKELIIDDQLKVPTTIGRRPFVSDQTPYSLGGMILHP